MEASDISHQSYLVFASTHLERTDKHQANSHRDKIGGMSIIDYAQIDCEIRPIVELMHRIPGLQTLCSCAGHREGEESAVAFESDQQGLAQILRAIQNPRKTEIFNNNRLHWAMATVDAALGESGKPFFTLRVSGEPRYYQRLFLGEIEAELFNQIEKRLSCSRCAPLQDSADS